MARVCQSVTFTEPPLSLCISNNELSVNILDILAEIDVLRFQFYLQAVECYVKLVSESSTAVCGNGTPIWIHKCKNNISNCYSEI